MRSLGLTKEERRERERLRAEKRRATYKSDPEKYSYVFEKARERAKRNYWKDREKSIKQAAEYRNKNREIILPKRRAWYQENKERLRLKCKEYNIINKEKRKEYRLKTKCERTTVEAKRRALKHDAIPKKLKGCKTEQKKVLAIFKLKHKLQKEDGIPRHVDHMWPLNDGGPHWSGNLQVLTAVENTKKAYKVCPIIKKQIQRNLEEARVL